ncbi:MAG TPA: hypothetical protein PLV61_17985 [Parvularculaceae bacterium]|nr:hypothetical protein [Caulobacterales bacterium]HPE33092.1 hypothetical protein [Parvularculaceae bacterium]HRX40779.1 hypothetical protein [Parvularculaceae bacterium]
MTTISRRELATGIAAAAAIGAMAKGGAALAEDDQSAFPQVASATDFRWENILNQGWERIPDNLSIINIPGLAGAMMYTRTGVTPDGATQTKVYFEPSNLPQDSYDTLLLDEVIYDEMLSVSDAAGLGVAHPLISLGLDFSNASMVRLTVKKAFRKVAPPLSNPDAAAELRKMARARFSKTPDTLFYWVKAVEVRDVTLEKFVEAKKSASVGIFFISGNKKYVSTSKSTAVKSVIGYEYSDHTLAQLELAASPDKGPLEGLSLAALEGDAANKAMLKAAIDAGAAIERAPK